MVEVKYPQRLRKCSYCEERTLYVLSFILYVMTRSQMQGKEV
jgi:hypothetical protein